MIRALAAAVRRNRQDGLRSEQPLLEAPTPPAVAPLLASLDWPTRARSLYLSKPNPAGNDSSPCRRWNRQHGRLGLCGRPLLEAPTTPRSLLSLPSLESPTLPARGNHASKPRPRPDRPPLLAVVRIANTARSPLPGNHASKPDHASIAPLLAVVRIAKKALQVWGQTQPRWRVDAGAQTARLAI